MAGRGEQGRGPAGVREGGGAGTRPGLIQVVPSNTIKKLKEGGVAWRRLRRSPWLPRGPGGKKIADFLQIRRRIDSRPPPRGRKCGLPGRKTEEPKGTLGERKGIPKGIG